MLTTLTSLLQRRKSGRLDGKPKESAQERRERNYADVNGATAKNGGATKKGGTPKKVTEHERLLEEHGALKGDKGRDR